MFAPSFDGETFCIENVFMGREWIFCVTSSPLVRTESMNELLQLRVTITIHDRGEQTAHEGNVLDNVHYQLFLVRVLPVTDKLMLTYAKNGVVDDGGTPQNNVR